MGWDEGKTIRTLGGDPSGSRGQGRGRAWHTAVYGTGPTAVGERVVDAGDLFPDVHRETGLGFHELAEHRVLSRIPRNLASGKGPQPSEEFGLTTSNEEGSSAGADVGEGDRDALGSLRSPRPRERGLQARVARETDRFERAGRARRPEGGADGGPEFHEGLVEVARGSARQPLV